MTTATGRRFTSVERAGIRYLAQSPQFGPFRLVTVASTNRDVYVFARRAAYWIVVRQAARDSREAANTWRCVDCDRLMPYFLKRCKACQASS